MNKPTKKDESTAHLWTLISCLYTANYCLRELAPTIRKDKKMRRSMDTLFKSSQGFIAMGTRGASKKQKELLHKIGHDSVAVIAETVAIVAHVPTKKIDEFCDEINELAKKYILEKE